MAPLRKGLTNAVDRAEQARKAKWRKFRKENAGRLNLGPEIRKKK